jgi:hypothetical protein
MAFDSDTLNSIYASTQGFCHRCRRKLAFSRFGCCDGRGAWDIDAVSPHPKVTALLPGCLRCVQKPTPRRIPKSAPAPAVAEDRPPAAAEDPPDEPAANSDEPPYGDTALVGGAAGAVLGGLWGAVLGGLIAIGLQLWG